MNKDQESRYCIICGEAFIPNHLDVDRCPEHGGEGRLVGESEKADEPQRTKLDPAGPGEPTRLDDGREGQPTKRDDGPQGTLVDGDPSLVGEKPPISLGKESEEDKDDGDPVQTQADVPVEWEIGDRILDLYEVKGVLGKGGFGVVYRVYHTAWDLDLAVKSPLAKKLKEGGTEDFVSEAEDWMDLGLHPYITTCHYVRTLGGVPRVFAELVEGGSLHDWMAQGRLYEGTQEEILKRLLDIAVQFAWGLDYAHAQGMIHQDVKPENALMTEEGSVKVTDFGLVSAKAVDEEVKVKAKDGKENKSLLAQGQGMTPAYCSPEQSMGQMLSRRTDLWSWGLSLLALFAGERFWGKRAQWATGPLAEDYLNHYLEEGPKRAGIPRMPDGLVSLLQEVFQEDPEDRPHDMDIAAQQVIEVYEEELGEPYPREKPEAAELRADSLNNRALSLMDLGREEEAEKAWEQALEVDSHHPQTTYNYGLHRWRYAKIDDQQLVKELNAVIEAQPEDWEPRYLLALVHMERDDCQGAKDMLETIPAGHAERDEVSKIMQKAQERFPQSTRCLRTFQGHEGPVHSIHLSADGRHALSGSSDETLKLWDVETGDCLRTFQGHEGSVYSVQLSADGRYALSGSDDENLKLWDVETGKCLRTFQGHVGYVMSVQFSADGRYALSGSEDNTLKLWEVETGKCLRTFQGHVGTVHSVHLSADGHHALSVNNYTDLKLWDVETGECLRNFEGPGDYIKRGPGKNWGNVSTVQLSADGQYALSGSLHDKTLKLWDVETGECLRTFQGHEKTVSSVHISTDGRYALSGSRDKTLKLWDVETGKCLRTFQGSAWSVHLSADGRCALSGSSDKTLKLWSISVVDGEFKAPIQNSRLVEGEGAVEREEQVQELLARAGEERKIGRYQMSASLVRKVRTIPGFERTPEVLEAWSSLYNVLQRTRIRAGWEVRTFQGHESSVNSVQLSADGRYALSGNYDKTLKLWEVETGECLRTFEGHENSVRSVHLSADGRYALSGSYDKTLKLWDVETGECLRTFEGHERWVTSVCLSADGRFALSGSKDNTLKLWDVETGECLRTFQGHEESVYSVHLSADSRYALSGSNDKTLKLWDVETGECLRTFRGHEGSVRSVQFSADGRYALSGCGIEGGIVFEDLIYDCPLKLWFLDWELEAREPADWDEGARPYLENYLTLHTPYAGEIPQGREPTEEEIQRALTRQGTPTWTEEDFQRLLTKLGYAGFGWLRPEGVRQKLQEMAQERG